MVYPADRIEIGSYSSEKQQFTNHEIKCSKGDVVYLFSDGFTDQVGGKDRKKYKSQKFREFLLSVHNKSVEEQKHLLEHEIETWKGQYDQIDDILVMGIRISGPRED
jgi:serine phosphatase RsbU (regulator of sigma subunit)